MFYHLCSIWCQLKLVKKEQTPLPIFSTLFFTLWIFFNGTTFSDILINILHCDFTCMPISFFVYTVHFLILLLIIHYPNTVRFFMKTFLTVYIGFQSYYILYTNFSSIINFLITMPNFVFIIPICPPPLPRVNPLQWRTRQSRPKQFKKMFSHSAIGTVIQFYVPRCSHYFY